MVRILAIILLFISFGFSLTVEEERQLLKDMAELKVQVAEIKATLKTFMEQTDRRFEQIERQIDRLVQIMVAIFAGQIALVGVVIGILILDRRTMAKRVAEETYEKFEKGDFRNLVNAFKELARDDERVEKVLKKHNLL